MIWASHLYSGNTQSPSCWTCHCISDVLYPTTAELEVNVPIHCNQQIHELAPWTPGICARDFLHVADADLPQEIDPPYLGRYRPSRTPHCGVHRPIAGRVFEGRRGDPAHAATKLVTNGQGALGKCGSAQGEQQQHMVDSSTWRWQQQQLDSNAPPKRGPVGHPKQRQVGISHKRWRGGVAQAQGTGGTSASEGHPGYLIDSYPSRKQRNLKISG